MTKRKNKAQSTKEKAKAAFPDTPREDITPCAKTPYFKNDTREDYVLATNDEAKKKALELAGIDPDKPLEGERNEEIRLDGKIIGYKAVNIETGKTVAEVHFHPKDLAGHPPHTLEPAHRDYISEMPHYNYANWRGGKKDGRYGHVVFQD